MEKKHIKILAIDGGGIRGLIPAIVLKEIKNRLELLGKKESLVKYFDIISGCSTGGIIALGLAKPKIIDNKLSDKADLSIDDLIDFYEENGKDIFPDSNYRKIKQIFDEKYSANFLEKILYEKLGDITIDDALTNILIPAYDIENRNTRFFKKRPKSFGDKNYYMKDIARATSAAPTYFEPAQISAIDSDEKEAYIDGGMFENNPAMAAYIEALKIYPDAEYTIISLGTGVASRSFSYEETKDWGMLGWAAPWKGVPILSILMSAHGISVDHQLSKIPSIKYYRFNSELKDCKDELDNASDENLNAIRRLSAGIIKDNSEKIDEICRML